MKISNGPIGELDKLRPVHIHGAGIAGLLMGHYLIKAGYTVRIFERSHRVGGKIQTTENEFGIAETAANAIYTNDDVYELLKELNLDYTPANSKLKKKVWRSNEAKSPPFKIKELFKIIFNLFKKVPIKNIHEQSVEDFFLPLSGKEFIQEVITPALGGIYAEDAKTLHFQSIFKVVPKNETYFSFFKRFLKTRKGKSKATSISFKEGMQTFINALAFELNDVISLNTSLPFDPMVNNLICTDAMSASEFLKEIHPDISNELLKISYNSLQTSTFISCSPINFLNRSFGVLFPHYLNQKIIGILNNTAIFPNRTKSAKNFSYTVISKDIDNNANEIKDEFIKITQLDKEAILFEKTTSWSSAIPIYDKNRFSTIMSIRSKMCDVEPGTIIFGNYIDGISIREMVSMAKNFAIKNKLFNSTDLKSKTRNEFITSN